MNTQTASIKTESGTTVRTSKGRRRPVYSASQFAVCPTCGAMDFADSIAAGKCTGCARILRAASTDGDLTTTCPHCATSQGMAALVANGCQSCHQMPNQPGKSF